MGSFRVPDVLFAVRAEHSAIVGDKVGCVVEQGWLIGLCALFDDCTRYDADLQFLGQALVVR